VLGAFPTRCNSSTVDRIGFCFSLGVSLNLNWASSGMDKT